MSALEDDIDTLETAMRLFFQTMKRPQRWTQITTEAGINIDRPGAVILHTLIASESDGNRVQDLANQLGIEAPSITRKTQELERLGYVKRVPDPQDKRAVTLHITARGRKANDKLRAVQKKQISSVLKEWDPAERRQFVELLHRYSADITAKNSITKG
ncbi:MAG TPA: MarR family transcriptional regulator [Candidatus Saccharimonadales bacterium]